MPIYEWRCPRGHEWEERQEHFGTKGKKPCPKCGATAKKKISQGTGFRLMGEDWPSVNFGATPGGSRD
jgi:putative FmdB family regulatory protein